MPLRPFPSPLNIGTDICDIARIKALYKRGPARFLRRVFTPRELAIYNSRITPRGEQIRMHYIAGRWAAKEAVIKAVQPRRVTLHQVEILLIESSRAPIAVILDAVSDHPVWQPGQDEKVENDDRVQEHEQGQGEDGQDQANAVRKTGETKSLPEVLAQVKAEDLEGQVVKISISHDGEYATAVAIAPEMPELESVAADANEPTSDPSLL